MIFKIIQLDAGAESWIGYARRQAERLCGLLGDIAAQSDREFSEMFDSLDISTTKSFSKTLEPATGVKVKLRGMLTYTKTWIVRAWITGAGNRVLYGSANPQLPAKRKLYENTVLRVTWFRTSEYVISDSDYSSYAGISAMTIDGAGVISSKVPWEQSSVGRWLRSEGRTQTFINVPWGHNSSYVGTPPDNALYFMHGTHFARAFPPALEDNLTLSVAFGGVQQGRYVVAIDQTAAPSTPKWGNIAGWAGGDRSVLTRGYPDDPNNPDYAKTTLVFSAPLDTAAPTDVCGYQGVYADPAWGFPYDPYTLPDSPGTTFRYILLMYGKDTINFVSSKTPIVGSNPTRYNYYRWMPTYDYTKVREGNEVFWTGTDAEGGVLLVQTAHELAVSLGMSPGVDPFAVERAEWYSDRATKPLERDRLWRKQLSDADKAALISGTMPRAVAASILNKFPYSDNHECTGNLDIAWTSTTEGDLPPPYLNFMHSVASYTRTVTAKAVLSYDSKTQLNPDGTPVRVLHEIIGTAVYVYTRHRLYIPQGGKVFAPGGEGYNYELPEGSAGFWTVETTYTNYPLPEWESSDYTGENYEGIVLLNGSTYAQTGYLTASPNGQAIFNQILPASLHIDGFLREFDVPPKYLAKQHNGAATLLTGAAFFNGPSPVVASLAPAYVEYRSLWSPKYVEPVGGEGGGGL